MPSEINISQASTDLQERWLQSVISKVQPARLLKQERLNTFGDISNPTRKSFDVLDVGSELKKVSFFESVAVKKRVLVETKKPFKQSKNVSMRSSHQD